MTDILEGQKCPECGEESLERQEDGIYCGNPACDYVKKNASSMEKKAPSPLVDANHLKSQEEQEEIRLMSYANQMTIKSCRLCAAGLHVPMTREEYDRRVGTGTVLPYAVHIL